MRSHTRWLSVLLVSSALAACGGANNTDGNGSTNNANSSGGSNNTTTTTTNNTTTTTTADAGTTTPPPADAGGSTTASAPAGDPVAGKPIYDRACGNCHPDGNEDVGPKLRDIRWAEARMVTQIRNGSGGMRAINTTRLPEENMPNLMAYLRSLRAVQ